MVLGITSETFKNVIKLKTPMLRDCFTSKYITAQIFNEGGGWDCVPLVQDYMHDDHIFVRLGKKVLFLKVDMTAIHTYRQVMSRPIQTMLFTTQDYMPFIPGEQKKLEVFCKKNGINRIGPVQAMFLHAASLLEQRNKKGEIVQESIKIEDVIKSLTDTLNPDSEDYATQVTDLESAASDLGTVKIMTPIKPISDILDKKMHNSPLSIFQGFDSLRRANFEWIKIASPARTPFGHWMLVVAIIGMVGLMAAVAYAYDAGLIGGSSGLGALDELLEKAQEFASPEDYLANKTGAETTAEELAAITEKANEVPAVTEKTNEVPAVEGIIEIPDTGAAEVPIVTEEVIIIPEVPIVTEEVIIIPEVPIVTEKIVEVPIVPKPDVNEIIDYFNPDGSQDGWTISSADEVEISGSGSLIDEELTESADLTDLGRPFPDYSLKHDTPDEIVYYTQGNDTEVSHEVTLNNEELNEILKKESIVESHYHDNFNPESGMFDKPIEEVTKESKEFVQDFN